MVSAIRTIPKSSHRSWQPVSSRVRLGPPPRLVFLSPTRPAAAAPPRTARRRARARRSARRSVPLWSTSDDASQRLQNGPHLAPKGPRFVLMSTSDVAHNTRGNAGRRLDGLVFRSHAPLSALDEPVSRMHQKVQSTARIKFTCRRIVGGNTQCSNLDGGTRRG